MDFNHNFCESRLNNNNPPELFNAWSSLIISIIPLLFKRKIKSRSLMNIKLLFIFNGLASFIYHYTLSWFGKHLDEISMILSNYYGICFLLKFINNRDQVDSNNQRELINMLVITNLYLTILFMCVNTIPFLDFLFPNIFGFFLIPTLYLTYQITIIYKLNRYKIIQYLLFSFWGAICWIISENFCNEYTKYGHILWHILFPLGFYLLVLYLDFEYNRIFHPDTLYR